MRLLGTESLRDLMQMWEEHLSDARQYSMHTVNAYQRDMTDFIGFLGGYEGEAISENVLEQLPITTFRAWLSQLKQEEKSPRTVARAVSSVKNFYHYLQRQEGIENAAINHLRVPKAGESIPRAVSAEQSKEILDEIGDWPTSAVWVALRDRAILALLYGCGLRIGAASSLPAIQAPAEAF
jgi:integrase/recombinase XerC